MRFSKVILFLSTTVALAACEVDVSETLDASDTSAAADALPETDTDFDPDGTDALDVAEDTAEDAVDTDASDAPDVEDVSLGELVEVPAEPDPDAETEPMGEQTECGQPRLFTGRGLRRAPYIQSVFTESARIAWTDTFGASGFVHFNVLGTDEWYRVDAEPRVFTMQETNDVEDYTAYEVALVNLPTDSTICYEVYVDGALLVAGASFHTAWTTHDKPVRILAMGDSGNGTTEQLAVRDRMMEVEADLFLHLGDMAYGSGTYPEFEAFVFGVYRDLMAAIPAWPTPGNHEYKTGLADGYIGVYYLPEQAPNPLEQEYYYSFDYGNVHFISIDSNEFRYLTTISASDEDMLGWLERDLAAAQDSDWIIAFMHHPPYSSGSHGNTNWLLEVVVPMLEDAGVDLVLAGHDHHYERTLPVFAGEVAEENPDALTYVVAGAGGAGLREALGDWWTDTVDFATHNFLHLEIDGCQARGTAIGLNGEIVDTFELVGCQD